MSKKDVIIYPVLEEVYPFLEFLELREDICGRNYCVPDSWSTCHKKIIFENAKEIELLGISECILKKSCNEIIILNEGNEFQFNEIVEPYIEKFVRYKKKLCFTKELKSSEEDMLKKCGINYEQIRRGNIEFANADAAMRIFKVGIPIVFVLGMFENTEKLSTVLYVHNFLKEKGYKVKTVLTKENVLNIPDCYSFPSEMLEKNYGDAEKILFFNHYVRRIEINEKPDIIVIGIPGEIMPLNEKHNGNFGTMPFLIGNAVSCDYAILNVFSNFSDEEFAKQLMTVCKNRYLIDVNAIEISRMVLDISSINMDEVKVYRFSESIIREDERFFYNRKNNVNVSLGDDLLAVLSDYGNYSKI